MIILFLLLPCGSSGTTIASIERLYSSPDTFLAHGSPHCNETLCAAAHAKAVHLDPCRCVCHDHLPLYDQHQGQCVQKLDGCSAVPFVAKNSATGEPDPTAIPALVPAVFLPHGNQILNPAAIPLWTEAQVASASACSIEFIAVLTTDGWRTIDAGVELFALQTLSNTTYIKWKGDTYAQEFLSGRVLRLFLTCNPSADDAVCATFRTVGKENPQVSPDPVEVLRAREDSTLVTTIAGPRRPGSKKVKGAQMDPSTQNVALIVGIVCGVLLILSLLVGVGTWTYCWRRERNKLVRKMQMQYGLVMYGLQVQNGHTGSYPPPHMTYPQQQQQQQQVNLDHYTRMQMYAQQGSPLPERSAMSEHVPAPDYDMTDSTQNQCQAEQQQQHTPMQFRKKLYFSPEFFEPEYMSSPPPMAQEFLTEVRKMISIAKSRIRSRRYVPNLHDIPEDESRFACNSVRSSLRRARSNATSRTGSTSSRGSRKSFKALEDESTVENEVAVTTNPEAAVSIPLEDLRSPVTMLRLSDDVTTTTALVHDDADNDADNECDSDEVDKNREADDSSPQSSSQASPRRSAADSAEGTPTEDSGIEPDNRARPAVGYRRKPISNHPWFTGSTTASDGSPIMPLKKVSEWLEDAQDAEQQQDNVEQQSGPRSAYQMLLKPCIGGYRSPSLNQSRRVHPIDGDPNLPRVVPHPTL